MKPYILPAFIVKSSPHNVALSTRCSGHESMCCQQTSSSLQQSQVNDDSFLGLTDDGDFAMFGVNIDEITTTDSSLDNDNISIKDDSSIERPPSSSGFGANVSLNDALFGRLTSPSATTNDITTTFAQSITLLDDIPTTSS